MKRVLKIMLRNKFWFISFLVCWLIVSFTTGYTLFAINKLNGIENLLRLLIGIALIIIWLLILLLCVRRLVLFNSKNKINNKKKYIFLNFLFLTLVLLYSFGLYFISNNVDRVVNKLENVSSEVTTYSSSLITLSSNEVTKIEDIGDSKLGILIDESSYEGYIIPQEVISELKLKNDVKLYDNYIDALTDLYDEKIKYIFVPTNYGVLFSSIEDYENVEEETKIIYTREKEEKSEMTINTKGSLDKPFTVLLMGVDSEKENIKGASFNGDSLMLITFNPNTLNATIMSIPRDTYTNIACMSGNRKNKITHAAWQGENCMIKTIQQLTDIKIDYYVKINFKGVVNLVNAVGGVEVDVPYAFCEQNSSRKWGKNTVYVEKGLQTLDGEQALAFARNRHPWPKKCPAKYTNYKSNDFIRGQNQQTIVKALLNKLKDVRSLDTFYDILDTISNSMETNMSTSEILSLYNVAKNVLAKYSTKEVEDIIGMQRLYISGYDAYIYDYSQYNGAGMKRNLYNFVPYKGSIKDVTTAMKVNLELEKEEVIKEFEFDVDDEYKETVIGKGKYSESKIPLLANLVGMTELQAKNYASKNDLEIKINYVAATDASQKLGTVVSQSIKEKADLEYIYSVTVDVINQAYVPVVIPPVEEPIEDDSNNDDSNLEQPEIDNSDDSDVESSETESDSTEIKEDVIE